MSIMNEKFRKYTDEETFSKIVSFPSITAMWEDRAATYADRVAIVDGEEYTYARLNDDVAAFRSVLAANGATPGSLIGILCPNSYGFVKAYLAATTFGVPAVLMPTHLDEMTVFGIASKFGMKALVYDQSLEAKVAVLREKNPAVALIPSSATADTATPSVPVPAETPAAILFTGGTTGKSKGAKLSHKAVLAGTMNGCYGIREIFCQRYLLVLPLTHVFGLIRNLMTSLYTGSALFICRNNKDMFRDTAVFKPTIMVLVPALAGEEPELTALYAAPEDSRWLLWPVAGSRTVSLSFPYGLRDTPTGGHFHSGIDIPAERGTAIAAAAAGTVVETGFDSSLGNYLVIDHGDGLTTTYGQCQTLVAAAGDTVEPGDTVALLGATGMATGPHLHFEVRQDGEAQNPVAYFGAHTRAQLPAE